MTIPVRVEGQVDGSLYMYEKRKRQAKATGSQGRQSSGTDGEAGMELVLANVGKFQTTCGMWEVTPGCLASNAWPRQGVGLDIGRDSCSWMAKDARLDDHVPNGVSQNCDKSGFRIGIFGGATRPSLRNAPTQDCHRPAEGTCRPSAAPLAAREVHRAVEYEVIAWGCRKLLLDVSAPVRPKLGDALG